MEEFFFRQARRRKDLAKRASPDLLVVGNGDASVWFVTPKDHVAAFLTPKDKSDAF